MGVELASGSADYNGSKRSKSSSLTIDIETIRLHASSLYARLQSRVSLETLRPLNMFLGVSPSMCLSPEAFTPPVKKLDKSSPEKIKSRMQLNFAFFLTNYVLLASMVALVVSLMHPGMLFFVTIVYGLWSCHSFLIKNELEVFGIQVHSLLTIQQRFYVLFVITTIVVVWKCLAPTIIFVTISAILIVLHAFLRDPKHIETSTSELLLANNEEGSDEEGGGNSSGSEVLVERPMKRDVI